MPFIRVMYYDEVHGKLFTGWLCVLLFGVWLFAYLLFYPACIHVSHVIRDARDLGKGKAKRDDTSAQKKEGDGTPTKFNFASGNGNESPSSRSRRSRLYNAITSGMSAAISKSPTAAATRSKSDAMLKVSTGSCIERAGAERRLPLHLAGYGRNQKSLLYYRIKLVRRLCFLLLAVVAGILLIVYAFTRDDIIKGLLMNYSSGHQIAFTMAAGHFCCSVLEDYKSLSWVGGVSVEMEQAVLFPLDRFIPLLRNKHTQFQIAASFNYLFALCAYAFILQTSKLPGVGVQGLIAAVPDLFDIQRELNYSKDTLCPWLTNPGSLRNHWNIALALFLLSRTWLSLLWIYTLIPGWHGNAVIKDNFSNTYQIAFHVLVVYFTLFNIRCFWFWMRYARADEARATMWAVDDPMDQFAHVRPAQGSVVNSFPMAAITTTCASEPKRERTRSTANRVEFMDDVSIADSSSTSHTKVTNVAMRFLDTRTMSGLDISQTS